MNIMLNKTKIQTNMKKYLIMALAAFGLAACADNYDDTNAPVHNGELEESYIAINLMSADRDTRAPLFADDSYEMGTEAERAIKTAYFFFFDENGNPFNVTNAPATAPGGTKNHLALTIADATTSGMPNVSDIKNAVLVLKTYKGVYPSKIVAVLNWTPENKPYSLENLKDLLATIGNDANGYVMSNSVYMDGAGNEVNAVPLTTANIKTSENDALAAPVNIYVERTAAKVVVTADEIYDTEKTTSPIIAVGQNSEIKAYVKLMGWELYNDYSTSYLVKNINTAWDPTTLGLTWNDSPYYRCYWAASQGNELNDSFSWSYTTDNQKNKGFKTEYGFAVATAVDYTNASTYTYCGENTNGADKRTKVILKGQLMKEDGNGGYEALSLARWYGTEYAGEEALRIAVANSLKYTLFYLNTDENKYVSIAPEDLQCVAGSVVDAASYKVGFQLSTTDETKAKTWYKYDSEKGYQVLGSADGDANKTATNEELKTVEPALLYENGMTYYIVDIKHLGTEGKTAEYGVVRNHVYQIDIESIKGYGSPVYSALDFSAQTPEYPEDKDESSFVAAKINVLSWKIVKQGVNIQQ